MCNNYMQGVARGRTALRGTSQGKSRVDDVAAPKLQCMHASMQLCVPCMQARDCLYKEANWQGRGARCVSVRGSMPCKCCMHLAWALLVATLACHPAQPSVHSIVSAVQQYRSTWHNDIKHDTGSHHSQCMRSVIIVHAGHGD